MHQCVKMSNFAAFNAGNIYHVLYIQFFILIYDYISLFARLYDFLIHKMNL